MEYNNGIKNRCGNIYSRTHYQFYRHKCGRMDLPIIYQSRYRIGDLLMSAFRFRLGKKHFNKPLKCLPLKFLEWFTQQTKEVDVERLQSPTLTSKHKNYLLQISYARAEMDRRLGKALQK
jgi:hypothetical protein